MLGVKEISVLLFALCGTFVFSAPFQGHGKFGITKNCSEILEDSAGKLFRDFKAEKHFNFEMVYMRAAVARTFKGLPNCTFSQQTSKTEIFHTVLAFNKLFKCINASDPHNTFLSSTVFDVQDACIMSRFKTSNSDAAVTCQQIGKFREDAHFYYAFEYYKKCMENLALLYA